MCHGELIGNPVHDVEADTQARQKLRQRQELA